MKVEEENGICVESLIAYPASIRASFLKKVYFILSMQLAFTTGISALFMLNDPTNYWVTTHKNISFICGISCIFVLCCTQKFASKHPHNIILLTIFTLLTAYQIGYISASYFNSGKSSIILYSFIITTTIFVLLTCYVIITKNDFHYMRTGLMIGLLLLLVFALLKVFITYLPVYDVVAGYFGTILFSGFILYDTSNMLHRFGPDDAVIACLELYLDIINIFVSVLQCLRMNIDDS